MTGIEPPKPNHLPHFDGDFGNDGNQAMARDSRIGHLPEVPTSISNQTPLPPAPGHIPSYLPQMPQQRIPASRRRFLGMPRGIGISVTVIAGLLVLATIAIIAIYASLSLRQAHEEAAQSYSSTWEEYDIARSDLAAAVSDARILSGNTSEDEVTDPGTLVDLKNGIDSAQKILDDFGNVEELDPELQKTKDLSAESDKLTDDTATLTSAEVDLRADLSAVESSADAKDAEVQAKKEEEQAAAEKKAKKSAKSISYKKLFRAGDSRIGEYFRFEGKIFQDAGAGVFMVNVTKEPGYTRNFWSDPVMLTITGGTVEKLLEDDVITFTAKSLGTLRYDTVIGGENEVPALSADGADVKLNGTN